MILFGKQILDSFASRHAQSRQAIRTWRDVVTLQNWYGPVDIKEMFPSADFLSGNRVLFNLAGNKYRLLVRVDYGLGRVLVLKIGTHQEYDRWIL